MTEVDSRLSLSNGIRQRLFWRAALPEGQTYIYFIQDDPGTPIKIGYTNRVGARVKALQTGNSRELRLIAVLPAPPCVETSYHRQLRKERVLGEWFQGPLTNDLASRACDISDEMVQAYDGSGRTPDIYEFDETLSREPFGPPVSRPANTEAPEVEVVQAGGPKRPRLRGIPSGAFNGPGLQNRWRLTPDRDAEVTVKYVNPATMDRTPSRLRSQDRPRPLRVPPEGLRKAA